MGLSIYKSQYCNIYKIFIRFDHQFTVIKQNQLQVILSYDERAYVNIEWIVSTSLTTNATMAVGRAQVERNMAA